MYQQHIPRSRRICPRWRRTRRANFNSCGSERSLGLLGVDDFINFNGIFHYKPSIFDTPLMETPTYQWEFQDPKMEVPYFWPYFGATSSQKSSPEGLFSMVGTSNKSVPEMAIDESQPNHWRKKPESLPWRRPDLCGLTFFANEDSAPGVMWRCQKNH